MMFSYGSGCSATLFSLKVHGSNLADYKGIKKTNSDTMDNLLKNRIRVSCLDYEANQAKKERDYTKNDLKPENNSKLEELYEGTYYLEDIDKMWRRNYAKKTTQGNHKLSYNKLSNKISADPCVNALGRINLL